jgi:hypothetical protein
MYDVMVSALVGTFLQSVKRVQLSGNTCESCSREKIRLFAILCASPVLMRSSRAVNIPTVTEMIRLCKIDPTCDLSNELDILVLTLRQLEAEKAHEDRKAEEEEEEGLPSGVQSLNFEAYAQMMEGKKMKQDTVAKEMETTGMYKPPVDRTRERPWHRGIQIARQRQKEMLAAGWIQEDLGCTEYPNRPNRLPGDLLMDPRA